ncbi:serine/threonine protein phosphatase [Chlorobium phaeovibrioides]|uniref:Metallophosphoesterase n=1 Tax=Chlorobium phaeovibrioides (strain DSM 265 / 1930) TaxID=290318 RepID=A4SG67_CHLPM|nr:metallophosphoesterase family protein [Chlorobium phaeovibrioides]RTY35817.1 serine/threonine protein phosphatase [Chlorobium phaeovibrioides]HCD36026.1 serine/threonine protein phosphatase [Chlorobium sp.]
MQTSLSEEHRIIAIGDIHGCINTLRALIEKINPRPDDQFVFLGDFIDRGENSKEVVDYLIELSQQFLCHFILGNHELMLIEYLKTGEPGPWLLNGGRATMDSYGEQGGINLPPEHMKFFAGCMSHTATRNWFFTHGGLDPELSIEENLAFHDPEELGWQREHMREAYLSAGSYPWEKTLVCGHTPTAEPIMLDRLIAIDTGCVYTRNPLLGKLTALILPERTIIQQKNIETTA